MKILVVSDTHGDSTRLLKVLEDNKDFDALIHLGDGENDFSDAEMVYPYKGMIYVGGNCDYGFHQGEKAVSLGGIRIFCCHGHRYNVKSGVQLLAGVAKSNDCLFALYGHTHVPKIETFLGVQVMNPGSLTLPRDGSDRSYGVIEISPTGEVEMKIIPFK